MEPDGDSESPPFWFQPPANFPRRRPSLINPVALILRILTLLILFYLLPPFLSQTNHILRPNSVKKSWDSLNILLVLFAILCGVFARRNDEAPPSNEAAAAAAENQNLGSVSNVSSLVNRSRQSVPIWTDFPDRKEYNNTTGDVSSGGGRLRKSSSSYYPDLRQESLWESRGGNSSRFFDDFEVNFYRSPQTPENFERRPRRRSHEVERREVETLVREISVGKFEVCSTPPPPKSPAPSPPPPSTATLKRRRSLHSVPRRGYSKRHRDEAEVISENRRPAPPPPPHLPPQTTVEPEFQFPVVISESADQNSLPPSVHEPQSAPSPPPSSKVLRNLFKKSGKSKRVHSVPTTASPPPPPPAPLPPNSIFHNLFKSSKHFLQPSTAPPPPPPPPSTIINSLFRNGSKSRRFKNAITSPPSASPPPSPPPPVAVRRRQHNTGKPPKPSKPIPEVHEKVLVAPPPPPFRIMRKLEDVVDVEVSVKSNINGDYSMGPGASASSISCPSPDVNLKADTFIARLRDEWRLEKINSIKEKRRISG